MKLRWPFQLLLLSIVVLSIYFPTLSAEVSLVDDHDAIASIYDAESYTIKEVFLPRVHGGGYYRPLIGLGYLVDKYVWDMNVRAMHLENIIMHLVNVFLVYLLTLLALKANPETKEKSNLPLVAALLFALHPIATESINWISGRTDPMAGNFILSAAILLLLFRTTGKTRHLFCAIALIVLGTLAKEASLGMILASGLILSAHRADSPCPIDNGGIRRGAVDFITLLVFYSLLVVEVLYFGNYWVVLGGAVGYAAYVIKPWRTIQSATSFHSKQVFKLFGIITSSSLVVIALYTVLRRIAFRSDVSKIGQTVKLMMEDTNYAISLFVGASGFYLKKFFIPLPLNFFILEIDPIFDLVGILVLLFCIYLMTRLTLASALFLAGVCMFIPALPFAFGTIAWTGYAERYIYISSAFWIVSGTLWLHNLSVRYRMVSILCSFTVPVLVVACGWQTFSRNIVWQKNITLLSDTVQKSPKTPVIREMYMQALLNANLFDQAKEQYSIGTSRSIFLTEGPDLIMVQVLMKEGRLDDALALCEKTLSKSSFRSERALKLTISLIDRMIGPNGSGQDKLLEMKKNWYESLLIKVSKDPMLFYNLGQKAIGSGDRHAATRFFEKANSAFPEGSPYKDYSLRLLMRLKTEAK